MLPTKSVRYLPKNPEFALPTDVYSLPETITRDLPPGFLEDTINRMRARGERKRDINPSILSVVCHEILSDGGSLDRYTLIVLATARYYNYQAKMALSKPEKEMKQLNLIGL
jgi:hypothetical protein